MKQVTLARFACILLAVLGWGSAQALYDDGPGRTVHSYESIAFDFGKDRYALDLAANALALQHEEVDTSGAALLRNRHEFTRPGT